MTDEGWGRDGSAETSAAAAGGNGGGRGGDGTAAAPNVVRFPGDWIGSLDELVPIDLEPPEPRASDANAFWDGDPAAAHEAVPAPEVARSNGRGPRAAGAAYSSTSSARSHRPVEVRHGGVRRLATAGLLVVMIAVAAAVHFAGGTGTQRGTDLAAVGNKNAGVRTLTRTVTAPATVTTTVPKRPTTVPARTRAPKRPRPRRTVTHRQRAAQRSRPVADVTVPAARSRPLEPTTAESNPAEPTTVESNPVEPTTVEPTTAESGPVGSTTDNASSAGSAQAPKTVPNSGCAQSPDSGCLP